jgi:hypothetical protein
METSVLRAGSMEGNGSGCADCPGIALHTSVLVSFGKEKWFKMACYKLILGNLESLS